MPLPTLPQPHRQEEGKLGLVGQEEERNSRRREEVTAGETGWCSGGTCAWSCLLPLPKGSALGSPDALLTKVEASPCFYSLLSDPESDILSAVRDLPVWKVMGGPCLVFGPPMPVAHHPAFQTGLR